MAAERITPEAVAAALDVLDGEERVILGDQVVVSIGFTNAAVKTLAPREMEELAAYLFALIERAPIRGNAPAYAPHRMVLGQLATELRGFAAAAGEPVGLQADLRSAGSKAEEKRIRARLADQAADFDRHVDDVIASHHAQGELEPRPEPTQPEEEPTTTPDAATTDEEPDGSAWML